MSGTVKVATVDDLPNGKTKGVTVDGKKIMIANVNGKFYAIGSVCTHMGGPLDKGRLDGNVVTCPWHGSRFDVTSGNVVGGPARNPEPAYQVKVQEKDLLLEV